jgi:hypothetical protein
MNSFFGYFSSINLVDAQRPQYRSFLPFDQTIHLVRFGRLAEVTIKGAQ